MRCDLCGDPSYDGDEVVEYTRTGDDEKWAHIECAQDAGWED